MTGILARPPTLVSTENIRPTNHDVFIFCTQRCLYLIESHLCPFYRVHCSFAAFCFVSVRAQSRHFLLFYTSAVPILPWTTSTIPAAPSPPVSPFPLPGSITRTSACRRRSSERPRVSISRFFRWVLNDIAAIARYSLPAEEDVCRGRGQLRSKPRCFSVF